jgi:hypothetical protein
MSSTMSGPGCRPGGRSARQRLNPDESTPGSRLSIARRVAPARISALAVLSHCANASICTRSCKLRRLRSCETRYRYRRVCRRSSPRRRAAESTLVAGSTFSGCAGARLGLAFVAAETHADQRGSRRADRPTLRLVMLHPGAVERAHERAQRNPMSRFPRSGATTAPASRSGRPYSASRVRRLPGGGASAVRRRVRSIELVVESSFAYRLRHDCWAARRLLRLLGSGGIPEPKPGPSAYRPARLQ